MSVSDETYIVFVEIDGQLSVVAAGDREHCDGAVLNCEAPGVRAFKRRVTSANAVYAATDEVV